MPLGLLLARTARPIKGIRVIGRLTAFARFWYDFFVGDDWTVAVGVVVAFGRQVWV
jgi:hypothetical protein